MTSLRRLLILFIFCFLSFPSLLQAAVIGYLQIEGIQGEVSVAPYEGDIEILGFGQGLTMPVSVSSGMVVDGRASFQDIRVTKAIDSSSPPIYLVIAKGTVIPTVMFKFVREGALYYTIELTDAIISGAVPSMGSSVSTEMISFAFRRIRWTAFTADGRVESGWDLETNSEL